MGDGVLAHSDMQLLRKCSLSNNPAIRFACGDYWGGDIGKGSNAAAIRRRDQFMYARCTNDTAMLRDQFRFNVSPTASPSTDNTSALAGVPTDALTAADFQPMRWPPAAVYRSATASGSPLAASMPRAVWSAARISSASTPVKARVHDNLMQQLDSRLLGNDGI